MVPQTKNKHLGDSSQQEEDTTAYSDGTDDLNIN